MFVLEMGIGCMALTTALATVVVTAFSATSGDIARQRNVIMALCLIAAAIAFK